MTCKKCENRDKLTKVLQVISWAFYIAPAAYSAYKIIRDTGVIDKAKDSVRPQVDKAVGMAQPYVDSAIEYAKDLQDKAQSFVSKAGDEAKEVVSDVKEKEKK